jgi:hypothetical protein
MTLRLDEFPDAGRVLAGNPPIEESVRRHAEREGLDYFLSSATPMDSVYVLDMDAIYGGVGHDGIK